MHEFILCSKVLYDARFLLLRIVSALVVANLVVGPPAAVDGPLLVPGTLAAAALRRQK